MTVKTQTATRNDSQEIMLKENISTEYQWPCYVLFEYFNIPCLKVILRLF